jgi:hypothetical protein
VVAAWIGTNLVVQALGVDANAAFPERRCLVVQIGQANAVGRRWRAALPGSVTALTEKKLAAHVMAETNKGPGSLPH